MKNGFFIFFIIYIHSISMIEFIEHNVLLNERICKKNNIIK